MQTLLSRLEGWGQKLTDAFKLQVQNQLSNLDAWDQKIAHAHRLQYKLDWPAPYNITTCTKITFRIFATLCKIEIIRTIQTKINTTNTHYHRAWDYRL